MSLKLFTVARGSQLISNAPPGGVLPQIQSGEKRVGIPRTTFGSTASSTCTADVLESQAPPGATRARIVEVNGDLVVVYENPFVDHR
jgi:hypothetical protein